MQVQEPVNGDDLTVESTNIGLEAEADWLDFLRTHVAALEGTKKVVGAGRFVGYVASGSITLFYGPVLGDGVGKVASGSGSDRIELFADFDLPLNAVITSITERIYHDASGVSVASCQVSKLKRSTTSSELSTGVQTAILTSPTLSGSAECETFALTLSGTPANLKKSSVDEYFRIHFSGQGTGVSIS